MMVEGTFGLTLPPPTESLCPSFQGRLMIINLGLLLDHPQCEQDLGAELGDPVTPQEEQLLVPQVDHLLVVVLLLH